MNIRNVRHDVVPAHALDCTKADDKLETAHPLGDVYLAGEFGYVQSGYNWLRFRATEHNLAMLSK